jgi:hypothetical protein
VPPTAEKSGERGGGFNFIQAASELFDRAGWPVSRPPRKGFHVYLGLA